MTVSVRLASFVAVTLLLAASLTGCWSADKASTASGTSDLISLAEIAEHRLRFGNAYALVRALRPRWISNVRDVRVFYNRAPYGGPESLRDFSLDGIRSIRYVGLKDSYRYTQSDRPAIVLLVTSR